MNYIHYGSQTIDNNDIRAVVKAIKSRFLTTGPLVNKFEKKLSNYVGSKYAVACSSGTAALHIAFKAIRLKKNQNVILPSINFIASANICNLIGAKIFFADVDKFTGQMTPSTLLDCIKKNKLKKIKAICTMHHGGAPFEAEKFKKLKKKYKFFIIEDCCHSLGAKYSIKKNEYVGNCKYSDISTFSFHPVKTITTCEGGMITTNNLNFYNQSKLFRNHGIEKKLKKNINNWSYKINNSGLNYRMSEIHAALGISQLNKIEKFVNKRNKIAKIYYNKLKNFFLTSYHLNKKNVRSAYHLFIINYDFNKLKINKNSFIQKLHKKNIGVQIHYIPNNHQPIFKKNKLLPNSINFFLNSLSLPIYPNLKIEEISKICKIILDMIKKFKKN